MKRLEKFKDRVANHPLYNRLANRLSESEFDRCVEFIEDHDSLDADAFERKVVRMHLDKDKSKNWTVIEDLLLMCNSGAKTEEK